MEPETAQELMEIQSSLQEKLAIKSEYSYYSDESGKTADSHPTFKRPPSCSKCGKVFTTISKLEKRTSQ